MSQYGYGYGPPGNHPPGHQPLQPYGHQQSHTYSLPQSYQNGTAQADPSPYGVEARESFEYNRAAIPGLGMGFPSTDAGWPQPWSQPASTNHPDGGEPKTLPNPTRPDDSDMNDAMEEGELSEGEDIYEPGDSKDAGQSERLDEQQTNTVTNGANGQIDLQSNQGQEQSMRDRSGSYSPYLSPREVQSDGQENGVAYIDISTQRTNDAQVSSHARDSNQASQVPLTVPEAKKRAKDAILRLWPLNVKYENYIADGVDKTVLDELFMELGLATGFSNNSNDVSAKSDTVQLPRKPETLDPESQKVKPSTEKPSVEKQNAPSVVSSAIPPVAATTVPSDAPKAAANDPKDKTESRKDRIARLLAAKGTKSAPPAERKEPKPAPTKAIDAAKKKTQAEKSKLIQQKMRLLMQARKAQSGEQNLTDGFVSTGSHPPPPAPSTSPTTQEDPVAATAPASTESVENEPLPVATETSDPAQAPPIPGLFLSPESSSPPAAKSRKRPVAADLNESSIPEPQKRPFGQPREARPFLIDVSDDEDDAEMDIDSPEQRPSLVYRPTTPGSRTTSFRSHPALSDNVSRRPPHSPNNSATPTSGANGKIDLESMNKKIEDMKRMIAEAESRKRVKHSGNNSPSLSQSQVQSKEGSVEAGIEIRSAAATPCGDETSPKHRRVSTMTPSDGVDLRVQKARSTTQPRPSPRARVASERLPVVAARRREQLEQLKRLQAQVETIEREIQDGIDLEKRLEEEARETEEVEEDTARQQRSESASISNDTQQTDQHMEKMSSPDSPHAGSSHKPGLDSDAMQNQPPAAAMTIEEPVQNMHDTLSDDEADQDAPMDESSSTSEAEVDEADEVGDEVDVELDASQSDQPPTMSVASHSSDVMQGYLEDQTPSADAEEDEDVAMEEDADSSSEQEDTDESSDDYEPTESGVELPAPKLADDTVSTSTSQQQQQQQADSEGPTTDMSDADLQGVSVTSPIKHAISTANADSESDTGREVEDYSTKPARTTETRTSEETRRNGPIPYETPLQYFRSYRFHPKFKDSVTGGLRSLTYSNKIDVEKEVCPDQLLGGACPRGNECQYQHFESMQAADDQILLQLGAYGNYEGEQKHQYVAGLRQLLTDFRNRKIKDFDTIGQGIIEYRANFHNDKTKILPLGGVSI